MPYMVCPRDIKPVSSRTRKFRAHHFFYCLPICSHMFLSEFLLEIILTNIDINLNSFFMPKVPKCLIMARASGHAAARSLSFVLLLSYVIIIQCLLLVVPYLQFHPDVNLFTSREGDTFGYKRDKQEGTRYRQHEGGQWLSAWGDSSRGLIAGGVSRHFTPVHGGYNTEGACGIRSRDQNMELLV